MSNFTTAGHSYAYPIRRQEHEGFASKNSTYARFNNYNLCESVSQGQPHIQVPHPVSITSNLLKLLPTPPHPFQTRPLPKKPVIERRRYAHISQGPYIDGGWVTLPPTTFVGSLQR